MDSKLANLICTLATKPLSARMLQALEKLEGKEGKCARVSAIGAPNTVIALERRQFVVKNDDQVTLTESGQMVINGMRV